MKIKQDYLLASGFESPFVVEFFNSFAERLFIREVSRVNGKELMRCPFHQEKTPSFVMDRESYRCMSCGKSGVTRELFDSATIFPMEDECLMHRDDQEDK